MGMNNKILRIIEHCESDTQELSAFKYLLSEDCLRFKDPISLEQLIKFKLSQIITEVTALDKSSMLSDGLIEILNNVETIYINSNSFI